MTNLKEFGEDQYGETGEGVLTGASYSPTLPEEIEETKKRLQELQEKQREAETKDIYLEIPELGIAITKEIQFKGKKYAEIVKEVGEENIADYSLLRDLRNEGKKSNWQKYPFLKNFHVNVPQEDEVSKANGCVARFGAGSNWAVLGCWMGSDYFNAALGVFLIKKLKNTKNEKENKKTFNKSRTCCGHRNKGWLECR